mmetsp:Transcript_6175/g.11319  ORF Transcript_6175/g.11319 Transcript_6175/m.11319 type:complete len:88 (-) Transcript_6175:61-324(-)
MTWPQGVVLSCAPWEDRTHWKHTLFFLNAPVSVHRGDTVLGEIILTRNRFHRRHFRVKISLTTKRKHEKSGNAERQSQESREYFMWR